MLTKPTPEQLTIFEFCKFAEDYPSDFIEMCWGKECPIYNYLVKMFLGKSKGNFAGTKAFIRFFNKLDVKNRVKLLKWIHQYNQEIDYKL